MGRDILRDEKTKPSPGVTLCPIIGADASCIIGAQYTIGVCGLLHGVTGFASSVSVSIGVQAGAGVAVGVSMGPGGPQDLAGTSLTVSVGVTIGYGFEVGFGYDPAILAPASEPAVLLTPMSGLSVCITGGGDLEIAVGFEHTEVFVI